MYSANLVATLNDIASDYAPLIKSAVVAVLSQPRYTNTGAGADSVEVKVIAGSAQHAPEIRVEFADYVNLFNLRKLQWTKQPPVDAEFEQWAQTKSFSGPVPGYKNGLAPNLPPWKVKQRIVWAIAISKKKFDSYKAKPWRKKSIGNVLKEMNAIVLRKFDEAIELDFQQATKV